ncbi:MAG: aspartate aminotransferase family protein [Pyrinomonadaceae bacterium]
MTTPDLEDSTRQRNDYVTAETEQASLDMNSDGLRELAERASALVTNYFATISDLPVFPDTSAEEVAAHFDSTLPLEGEPLETLFSDCRKILDSSRHNGHPRFFGYVASPATPPGAFADLIASALNANVTSWRSAPAATEIERTVVRWLGSLVGFGDDAHGLLTSGGSMANLTALLIAHRTRSQSAISRTGLWRAGKPMTIYASDQIHLSIAKAADILGFGRDYVRTVPSDERFRLDVRSLRESIESDRRNGLLPFCVVASAGTVSTGAIDPLAEIAGVAAENDLWFHIDGAYGAPGAMVDSKRRLFDGMERADSLSLDPHKWLYTPIDCGCLLFRDPAHARAAFSTDADYIKVQEQTEMESFAFWDYGIELSRRFRALKIWLTLRHYGVRRIAEAIKHDVSLAKYMAERVEAADDFELMAPVELSICCFRYVPPEVGARLHTADEKEEASINAGLDQLNARIMHAVQRGGRAYVSNANIRERFALRACIINFRTTRADIDATLDIVRAAAGVI